MTVPAFAQGTSIFVLGLGSTVEISAQNLGELSETTKVSSIVDQKHKFFESMFNEQAETLQEI